ncbi:hypothetical protein RHE_CH01114 [Rhizobium etli CFN 42]|uniref:Uncharacterized protein n=1 Tax=Rhizobium etli (strain ATCC 51251 / DSM 11541 / JCM 21823 / NBRC 15573 / CFN 42) TaxID=347834 RepID=Q2KB65_RHIEC|nr:hypothetical protein RHE_CH01114 [Rhizobium etli CFN 42]
MSWRGTSGVEFQLLGLGNAARNPVDHDRLRVDEGHRRKLPDTRRRTHHGAGGQNDGAQALIGDDVASDAGHDLRAQASQAVRTGIDVQRLLGPEDARIRDDDLVIGGNAVSSGLRGQCRARELQHAGPDTASGGGDPGCVGIDCRVAASRCLRKDIIAKPPFARSVRSVRRPAVVGAIDLIFRPQAEIVAGDCPARRRGAAGEIVGEGVGVDDRYHIASIVGGRRRSRNTDGLAGRQSVEAACDGRRGNRADRGQRDVAGNGRAPQRREGDDSDAGIFGAQAGDQRAVVGGEELRIGRGRVVLPHLICYDRERPFIAVEGNDFADDVAAPGRDRRAAAGIFADGTGAGHANQAMGNAARSTILVEPAAQPAEIAAHIGCGRIFLARLADAVAESKRNRPSVPVALGDHEIGPPILRLRLCAIAGIEGGGAVGERAILEGEQAGEIAGAPDTFAAMLLDAVDRPDLLADGGVIKQPDFDFAVRRNIGNGQLVRPGAVRLVGDGDRGRAGEAALVKDAGDADEHGIGDHGIARRADRAGDDGFLRRISAFGRGEAGEMEAEGPHLVLRRVDDDLGADIIRAGGGGDDAARRHAVAGGEEHVAVGVSGAPARAIQQRIGKSERNGIHHRRVPYRLVRSS